jgi:heme exporter protein C
VVRALPYVLLAAAAAVFPPAVARIFLDTPLEREMGTAFKIFFFHLPLAWTMMLFAVLCGVAAGIQLLGHSRRADAIALASAELVFLTGLGVLITGSIWGHASWGAAWTWDARLVSTALLWLVFASYLLVRRYGGSGSERLAAALAVFGAVDVPIIYYAVKIWRTTHPKAETVAELPGAMYASLWPALAAFALLAFALVAIRVRQLVVGGDLDDAWIALDEHERSAHRKGVQR